MYHLPLLPYHVHLKISKHNRFHLVEVTRNFDKTDLSLCVDYTDQYLTWSFSLWNIKWRLFRRYKSLFRDFSKQYVYLKEMRISEHFVTVYWLDITVCIQERNWCFNKFNWKMKSIIHVIKLWHILIQCHWNNKVLEQGV